MNEGSDVFGMSRFGRYIFDETHGDFGRMTQSSLRITNKFYKF